MIVFVYYKFSFKIHSHTMILETNMLKIWMPLMKQRENWKKAMHYAWLKIRFPDKRLTINFRELEAVNKMARNQTWGAEIANEKKENKIQPLPPLVISLQFN
jgi:hypothetical protein